MTIETVAQIVADSLHHWDEQRIDLIAYTIMPNHVHAVFTLLYEIESGKANLLHQLMHSVKSFSAHQVNKLLNLSSNFWGEETYDRLVRNQAELHRIVRYILNNPVKANLCKDWMDWKWTYIKDCYNHFA